MILDADWAWLAGLLEGEGSFTLRKPRAPTHRPGICVELEMTDRDVVERAAELMQARSVYSRDRSDEDGREEQQRTYRCSVSGDRAERVMSRVLPWMGERRSHKIRVLLQTPDLSHRKATV